VGRKAGYLLDRGKILYIVTPKEVIEGVETMVRDHNATTAECLQLAQSWSGDPSSWHIRS
jgi:hypothetical protein